MVLRPRSNVLVVPCTPFDLIVAQPLFDAIDLIIDFNVGINFRIIHRNAVATRSRTDTKRIDQPIAGQHPFLREIANYILGPPAPTPHGRTVKNEVL